MMKRVAAGWMMGAMVAMLGAGACAPEPESAPGGEFQEAQALEGGVGGEVEGLEEDHSNHSSIVFSTPEAIARVFDQDRNRARLEYPDAFRQVGWMVDADELAGMEYRVERADGSTSAWEPVEVYWNEGRMFNARVRLAEAVHVIELRGFEGISFAEVEFFEEVVAPDEIQRAERPDAPGEIGTTRQAVAPRSLVIPRSEWGAINPDKICGDVVAPYRASIHHTYLPANDGGDAGARMRQMQSYHINTQGWCDIGYHFVISQAGNIYQGRSRSDRPGAHVGYQNSGNVGISYIADFTTQIPSQTQLQAGASILRWVHETHGVPLNRTAVKGHREWPGQSTSCPGDNMMNRLDTLLQMTLDLIDPPAPDNLKVALSAKMQGGDNFVAQGSSAGVDDALPGDRVSAEILLSNDADRVLRGVRLGYAFDEQGLTPVSYVIESDHPAGDQSSWSVNDATDAAGNPARDQMGTSGELIMNAFSSGESKRVVVEFEVSDYSFGLVPFGGVRAWVSEIEDVYAQSSFGAAPTLNRTAGILEAAEGLDLFDHDAWFFEGPQGEDVEGWSASGIEAFDSFQLNTSHGLLAQHLTGEGASITSPGWTTIDADRFGEVVIRARSHDGAHLKALGWIRDGESYAAARQVLFEAPGDGEYHDLVVDLSGHPQWSGEVRGLRVELLHGESPVDGESGWYDVDHIYVQDRASGTTSTAYAPVVDVAPVVIVSGGEGEAGEDGTPDEQTPGLGANDGDGRNVRTASGCATTGRSGGEAPLAALVALVGWVFARRRRHLV
ncbi:hypothetical protein DL240_10125 [Lujinxingia litoralis]|uniref:Peptidoglycan recognition protein family domain-containing protein n=1 Tax=Lujinxingia litoralis TaxID=2211119 RepID=A0A328C7U7_9DELT|nr:peptidoglycan recognition family protein [Lujinxingia litoralis]RAL22484.1 hypothetical protein DL240_10125 [Lujinxingia litoralis]